MSFVDTCVVFLLVVCMLLQTLVVRTMSSLSAFAWGKPTLRTFCCTVAWFSSHRKEKCHLYIFCLSASSMDVASNLGSGTMFFVSKFAWETHTYNYICNSIVIYVHKGSTKVICWCICCASASSVDVASNLGSTYNVFFISICLEKPTLRTFDLVALLSSHRQETCHLLIHVVFLLIVLVLWMLLQI